MKQDTCRAINSAGEHGPLRGVGYSAMARARRGAARLVVLSLAVAAAAFCQSVIVIDANNPDSSSNTVTPGSTVLLPKDDSGAAFTFNVNDPYGYASVYISFLYIDQGGVLLSNSREYTWINGVYTMSYPALGGSVLVSWVDQCSAGNLTFTVAGQNPDPSDVDAELASLPDLELPDPWFLSSLLAHEDYDLDYPYIFRYRQYADSGWPGGKNFVGMPLWGFPDGIGMGQYEVNQHPLNLYVGFDDYFSWTSNLIDSALYLSGLQSGAYQYWQSQLTASAYTPPPWTAAGAYCPLFGYPPGPGFADYGDTIWMTRYNQGPGAVAFIEWSQQSGQSAPQWNFPNLMYVDLVCQTPPI